MEKRTAPALGATLQQMLACHGGKSDAQPAVTEVVMALSSAAKHISRLVRKGPLAGAMGSLTGSANTDGDAQKALDLAANDLILAALKGTSVAYFASEEEEAILTLRSGGELAIAVDPLDGSSNIDANISFGTIFSIYAASLDGATPSLFRPGHEQLAAGYFVYGPHTALVLTTGAGTDILVLDEDSADFCLAVSAVQIPPASREFAINASNYRHWHGPVRNFIDDCVAGTEGPSGRDFNMRWVASLVAETHRIFTRGGVFLYPSDRRKGYEGGRLRLVYEANPIAMLVEQAGGRATDGTQRILEKVPIALHERTALIFGSAQKVQRIQSYHTDPNFARDQSPLFRNRGLFSS
jgi:fructose-1,6-bisphosphatase I